MCSIAYEPCNTNSFRIGPRRQLSPYSNQLIQPYPHFPGGAPYPYQANPYQANPYYPGAPLGNPIITPNGVVLPNPYAPNGIIAPNRIVYDANGNPSIIDPNGVLIPVNPNALAGKSTRLLSVNVSVNVSIAFNKILLPISTRISVSEWRRSTATS